MSPHPTRGCNETPTKISILTYSIDQLYAIFQRVQGSVQMCVFYPQRPPYAIYISQQLLLEVLFLSFLPLIMSINFFALRIHV